jgi:hypothetical protein
MESLLFINAYFISLFLSFMDDVSVVIVPFPELVHI